MFLVACAPAFGVLYFNYEMVNVCAENPALSVTNGEAQTNHEACVTLTFPHLARSW